MCLLGMNGITEKVVGSQRREGAGGLRAISTAGSMISLRVALFASVFSLLISSCHGQTFRFGTISWAVCREFEDVYFPDVCQNRLGSSSLRVGFTISAAWLNEGNSESTMLAAPGVFEDLAAFRSGQSRALRLTRLTSQPAFERRIGWMNGVGDSATIPPNGIFDCQTPPCPEEYIFMIDRLSEDERIVYARYSFELQFDSAGDYSVFFEGCCRPSALRNGAFRPFHLRASLSVADTNALLPTMSPKFTMPDKVYLKQGVNGAESYVDLDGEECVPNQMATQFQAQAFHPDDRFVGNLRFRLADANERGLYKCVEWDGAGLVSKGICSSALLNEDWSPPAFLQVNPDKGGVRFAVDPGAVGLWHVTLVAYCDGCFGAANAVPVEFLVEVVTETEFGDNTAYNPFPPLPVHQPVLVPNVAPTTTRTAPVSIQCGQPTWDMQGYSQDYLRVAFRDPDMGHDCSPAAQRLASIEQSNDLPPGVTIGDLQRDASDPTVAYVDVHWTPRCEAVSEVGNFMFCFKALDGSDSPGFKPLRSVPSYTTDVALDPTNPNCVHIRVLPPQLLNPAPSFDNTPYLVCSEDCCGCCGEAGCACEGVNECCFSIFASKGSEFSLPIQASVDDTSQSVMVNFTLDISDDVLWSMTQSGVVPPTVSRKYNCDDSLPFDQCVSDPTTQNEITAELYWDLSGAWDFTCNFQPPEVSQCSSLLDTCGGPGCDRTRLVPFKVCFYSFLEVPPNIDREQWEETFGIGPGNVSCTTCFSLKVTAEPFFVEATEQGAVIGSTPVDGLSSIAVGGTVSISLVAADTVVEETVRIIVLSDPGAPLGSSLSDIVEVPYSGVRPGGRGFAASFTFTARLGQEGSNYTVCFGAINSEGVRSPRRCYSLLVKTAEVTWGLTRPCPWYVGNILEESACPNQGASKVTVGCHVTHAFHGKSNPYGLALRMQHRPSCERCTDRVVNVTDCASSAMSMLGGGGGGMEGCCGNGRCDGVESGFTCPEDCGREDATLVQRQVGERLNGFVSIADFSWVPEHGTEGRELLLCVEALDVPTGGQVVGQLRTVSTSPVQCVLFQVARCAYCTSEGATLKHIARSYLQNQNWLRVYNSNVDLLHPDDVPAGHSLTIGPIYEVQPGDTLLSIAAMAQTSVRSLLENNPDVLDAAQVQQGAEICILLCTAGP